MVSSNLTASLDLTAGRDSPVKKSIEMGYPLAIGQRFHMLQEGGKSSDYLAPVKILCDLTKSWQWHTCFVRPEVAIDLRKVLQDRILA